MDLKTHLYSRLAFFAAPLSATTTEPVTSPQPADQLEQSSGLDPQVLALRQFARDQGRTALVDRFAPSDVTRTPLPSPPANRRLGPRDPRDRPLAPRDVTDTSAVVRKAREDVQKVSGAASSIAGRVLTLSAKFAKDDRFRALGKGGQDLLDLVGGLQAALNQNGEAGLKSALKALDRFKAQIEATSISVKAAGGSRLAKKLVTGVGARVAPHAAAVANGWSVAGDLKQFDAAMMRGDGKAAALALAAAVAHGVSGVGSGAAAAGASVAVASGGLAAVPAAPVVGVGEAVSIGFGILGDVLTFCAEDGQSPCQGKAKP